MGGMAEVFRARSVRRDGFQKEMCIKRILPQFCEEEEFVRMFIDEATLAARLQHANIVQIFDFDQVDGSYYIAMEFVEGRDLRTVIKLAQQHRMPLGPYRSAIIAAEMCKGLHYAHNKDGLGLVHRDVSPHNVLVSLAGEVKVMDFGIAKAADRITRTSTGIIKGKIAYMAPEQAAASALDHRVDQFATGLVLFEMLTGRRAFDGPEAVALRKAINGEVEPPSLVLSETPPELDEIFLRATMRRPEERFADMRAMERALMQFVYKRNPPDEETDLGAYLKALVANVVPRPRTQVLMEAAPGAPVPGAPVAGGAGQADAAAAPPTVGTAPAPDPVGAVAPSDRTASQPSVVAPPSRPAHAPVPAESSVFAPLAADAAPSVASVSPSAPTQASVPSASHLPLYEGPGPQDVTQKTPSRITERVARKSTRDAPVVAPSDATATLTNTPPGGLGGSTTSPEQIPNVGAPRSATTEVSTVKPPAQGTRGAALGAAALLLLGAGALGGVLMRPAAPASTEGTNAVAADPPAPPQPTPPAPPATAPPAPSPSEPTPTKADAPPASAPVAEDKPAARAPEKPAEVRRGTVNVYGGNMWGQVFWRGRMVLDETPGSFTLEAGRQTLTFKNPENGRTATTTVVVKPGSSVRLANPLK